MIRLFCDKCGKEAEDAEGVLGTLLTFNACFRRDLFPLTYYCNACYEKYQREVYVFEQDIAEKEQALEEAKKRLENFQESCGGKKEEGA